MRNIVVLTGAGISAESGLKTFRDADGLWEGHDVMEVATPEAFERNPELVLDFYNQRRRQLLTVEPNDAHSALAKLEGNYRVQIVTQNVDDLHERAGSTHVLHLHGELLKARSVGNESHIVVRRDDIILGDLCEEGYQLRPHIVWFGESVTLLDTAINITQAADILIIIGTSMQVYPAASLINFINDGTPIYFIDPRPSIQEGHIENLKVIPKTAAEGVPTLVDSLIDKAT